MGCKIMTWATYRKNLKDIQVSWDSSKGWSKTTVSPTMIHNGFTAHCANDIDLDKRKPRQILMEDFKHILDTSETVVYFVAVPTGNYAGFYKYLDIYFKPLPQTNK